MNKMRPYFLILYRFVYFCVCVCACVHIYTLKAQNAQEVFGKNRIQYKDFDWKYIVSPNLDIYYYGSADRLASHAAQLGESEFARIADLIGFTPYTKIKLYIYNTTADLAQSNIGLEADNSISGGKTSFVKSIVEVPFTGSLIDFRLELSSGIARALLYEMMYGGSFKDMVQSSYLLSLPDWFTEGAIAYVAAGWSPDMDNYLRETMLTNKNYRSSYLLHSNPKMAGQSVWNYIAERYGKANISNILNLTRILRNEESSISATLGVGYDKVIRDWQNFYFASATSAAASYQAVGQTAFGKNKSNKNHAEQLALSNDGRYLAYSITNKGRSSVIIQDLVSKKSKTIYSSGYRILSQRADNQHIALAWNGSQNLYISAFDKAKPTLFSYSPKGKLQNKSLIPKLDRVNSFDISADNTQIILSGVLNGQSDLYLYTLAKNTLSPITNDAADDLYPRFLPGKAGIVFSSNRLKDTLDAAPSFKNMYDNLNLFVLSSSRSKTVLRLTNSPYQLSHPFPLSDGRILYTSNQAGINNLYIIAPESKQNFAVSDYRQNIEHFAYSASSKTFVGIMLYSGLPTVFKIDSLNSSFNEKINLPTRRAQSISDRVFRRNAANLVSDSSLSKTQTDPLIPTIIGQPNKNTLAKDSLPAPKPFSSDEIDIRNYVFEMEKNIAPLVKEKPKPNINPNANNAQANIPIIKSDGPFAYKNRMSATNMTTTATIDQLLGLGLLVETSMNDMFENHKIKASLVMFNDLRSNNIYLEYQYLKKRIDFSLRYDKRNIVWRTGDFGFSQKFNLNRIEATAAYPISATQRISASGFFAQTRYVDLRLNALALTQPALYQPYAGSRIQYVFDNTTSQGVNMLEGMRIKAGVDYYRGLSNQTKSFGNLYIDARRYQKIHKEIVLAMRASYGNFFGPAAKNYLLGGMDNWILRRQTPHQRADNPMAFQTPTPTSNGSLDWLFMQFATNMRGFGQNAMYGRSLLLGNIEFRVPIVRYFYKGPISSNFFRHLQLTAFYDVGSSWNGSSPFGRNNLSNQRVVNPPTSQTSDPIIITVRDFKSPFLQGYGYGARTMLLGYYVKFDAAWGIQDYQVLKPQYYLTLGYDF